MEAVMDLLGEQDLGKRLAVREYLSARASSPRRPPGPGCTGLSGWPKSAGR
jgi:hypothetical protein